MFTNSTRSTQQTSCTDLVPYQPEPARTGTLPDLLSQVERADLLPFCGQPHLPAGLCDRYPQLYADHRRGRADHPGIQGPGNGPGTPFTRNGRGGDARYLLRL
ncbi:hypothetical protein AALK94_17480 [Bacteroides faecichinchillae]|uniref:hypothetical protein n=1 Tax=Bacteroides faecichinchillae TaxID=871325 RepID=UPI003514902D